MTRQVREVNRYSISFRQKVVREIEEEGMTVSEVRRRYGIGGGQTIQKWIRKFGKQHLLSKIVRIETMEERDQIKKMQEEIQKLKLALADSLMAQKCLESVITEANKEYKTDLKKSFESSASKNSRKPSR
jgi:transposase-like protein